MSIEFKDYTKIVLQKIHEHGESFLEEAGGVIEKQTKQNTKVDTGQTKGSWTHVVDAEKMEVTIGSPNINALYEELGTGIYALNGDGRKTKWVYKNPKDGKFYTTVGKKPRRALYNAYNTEKNAIIREAKRRFGEL